MPSLAILFLVCGLGADEYSVREVCHAALESAAVPNWHTLRYYAHRHPDPEVRTRLRGTYRRATRAVLDHAVGGNWPRGLDTCWYLCDPAHKADWHADPCTDAVWVRKVACRIAEETGDVAAVAGVLLDARDRRLTTTFPTGPWTRVPFRR